MAAPSPDLTLITCKWWGTTLAGDACQGHIELRYRGPGDDESAPMIDPDATHPIGVYPVLLTGTLAPYALETEDKDGNPVTITVGQAVFEVPASNDPDLLGSGGTYEVREVLTNATGREPFDATVDIDAPDGVVLLHVIPESEPIPGVAYGAPAIATSYNPGASGLAATTVQAAIDEVAGGGHRVVNVRSHGAKGDGTTDDTAAIDAAIDALTPGDTLLLPPGRYMTDGGHVIATPSVRILGAGGRAQTYNTSAQLYLRDGADADMLSIEAVQVTVRDLTLYGNKANQSSTSRGIVTPNTAAQNYLLLDSVWVDSFNGDGYDLDSSGGTLSATIVNSESRRSEGFGMRFRAGATDTIVDNCYIDQNVQSGVAVSAGDISFSNCHVWGNGTGGSGDRDGFTFSSSAGCRLSNCYIETNHEGAGIRFKTGNNSGHIVTGCDIWANGFQGIVAFNATNCAVTGNVIRHNNYKAQTGATGSGMSVESCTGLAVVGNQFFSTSPYRQTYGYYEISGCSGIRFSDNISNAAQHATGGVHLGAGTHADLGSIVVRKTSDTSVTSSTTLADDPDLAIPVVAGEVWEIDGLILVDGAQAGDIALRLSESAGQPTGYWRAHGPAASNSSTTAASYTPIAQAYGVSVNCGAAGAGVIVPIRIEGIATVTDTGTLALRWAQATSDATATTLKAGSFLRARRLAA